MPKDAPAAPAVMVIHENRGLNEHIKELHAHGSGGLSCAGAGFPDTVGGTPENEDQARDMISALGPRKTVANSVARCSSSKAMSGATARSARSVSAGAAAW
jgi:carboxymethylenebutenolidase